ncbi:hypothetical protein B0F90DRAFT_373954 [Multifurca ochricompacta]|uniref:Uncharacterized protein n=1 Tax=Multifurca ochricompacta TaxID=376703 RepID=A0AAD4M581_9AGAM|nr:hypothetical protein B0F90DRAFT_373954 [Multifurca ochricompacta]
MFTSRPVPLIASHPLHTRTPGRALQKAKGILQENAPHGPRTVKTHKVHLQSPLGGGSPKSRKLSKQLLSSKGPSTVVARPLGDKTPFANRQRRIIDDSSPGATSGNIIKRDANFGPLTSGHTLLPSSARKTVRGRHSSAPMFETPVTNGNHWDIVEGDDVVMTVPETQGEETQLDDYDEIEYMPPTAIDPPYTPHFDVPDYKLLGAQLFDVMHSLPRDDATDRFYAAEKENIDDKGLLEASGFTTSPSQWNFFELQEDDDPSPFTELRSSGTTSKRSANVPTTTQPRAMKGMPGAALPIRELRPLKQSVQSVPPVPSKRRQESRLVPTLATHSVRKASNQTPPARPATAAGRVFPMSRIAPALVTSRIPARPATSASMRPATTAMRTIKKATKVQASTTPLAANSEFVLKLGSVDVVDEDFMFNV